MDWHFLFPIQELARGLQSETCKEQNAFLLVRQIGCRLSVSNSISLSHSLIRHHIGNTTIMAELGILGDLQLVGLLHRRNGQRGMRARNPPVIKRRLDPLTALSDIEFKSHFRYSVRVAYFYNLFSF